MEADEETAPLPTDAEESRQWKSVLWAVDIRAGGKGFSLERRRRLC
jgi:hypothetical protein